jgi:hypothetical protein
MTTGGEVWDDKKHEWQSEATAKRLRRRKLVAWLVVAALVVVGGVGYGIHRWMMLPRYKVNPIPQIVYPFGDPNAKYKDDPYVQALLLYFAENAVAWNTGNFSDPTMALYMPHMSTLEPGMKFNEPRYGPEAIQVCGVQKDTHYKRAERIDVIWPDAEPSPSTTKNFTTKAAVNTAQSSDNSFSGLYTVILQEGSAFPSATDRPLFGYVIANTPIQTTVSLYDNGDGSSHETMHWSPQPGNPCYGVTSSGYGLFKPLPDPAAVRRDRKIIPYVG